MTEVFEADGTLVGWMDKMWISATKKAEVFIPRREEDIEADRAAIRDLFRRARRA